MVRRARQHAPSPHSLQPGCLAATCRTVWPHNGNRRLPADSVRIPILRPFAVQRSVAERARRRLPLRHTGKRRGSRVAPITTGHGEMEIGVQISRRWWTHYRIATNSRLRSRLGSLPCSAVRYLGMLVILPTRAPGGINGPWTPPQPSSVHQLGSRRAGAPYTSVRGQGSSPEACRCTCYHSGCTNGRFNRAAHKYGSRRLSDWLDP